MLLSLSLRGMNLEQVHKERLLGVSLDRQLTWSSHTDKIVAKISRTVSVIRSCANFLTDHSVTQVTEVLFLSLQLFGQV